jgi:Fe-Mn family superoxide dismutase
MDEKALHKLIKESVQQTFEKKYPKKPALEAKKETAVQKIVEKVKTLAESVILLPKVWILKTERLSTKTKEAHMKLYKEHLDVTNKIGIRLDAVNREVSDSDHSAFRSLKVDETENKNSVLLHELYFSNISDLTSAISADTLAYMRLARDWGTFDNWQFDFIACCMAAREGWAITYLDPYKNKYMNCVIDGDASNIPLGGIPVVVMDLHAHSYFYDYVSDKRTYVNAMMKELNWAVIEARIIVAEKANLQDLFAIMPKQALEVEKLLPHLPQNQPPIGKDQVITPKPSDPTENDQDQSTTPKKEPV